MLVCLHRYIPAAKQRNVTIESVESRI